MDDNKSPIAVAAGAALVVLLLWCIGMAAAYGPAAVAAFLSGPAASWAQAIGGIAAVGAAIQVGRQQSRENRALEDRRRAADEMQKLLIVNTLLSHAVAPVLIFLKNWRDRDYLLPTTFETTAWTLPRDAIARVDPFLCPDPEAVLTVVSAPRQFDRLLASWDQYVQSFRALPGEEEFARRARDLEQQLEETITFLHEGMNACAVAISRRQAILVGSAA